MYSLCTAPPLHLLAEESEVLRIPLYIETIHVSLTLPLLLKLFGMSVYCFGCLRVYLRIYVNAYVHMTTYPYIYVRRYLLVCLCLYLCMSCGLIGLCLCVSHTHICICVYLCCRFKCKNSTLNRKSMFHWNCRCGMVSVYLLGPLSYIWHPHCKRGLYSIFMKEVETLSLL